MQRTDRYDSDCATRAALSLPVPGVSRTLKAQLPLRKKKRRYTAATLKSSFLVGKLIYLASPRGEALGYDGMKQIDVGIEFDVERGRKDGRNEGRKKEKKKKRYKRKTAEQGSKNAKNSGKYADLQARKQRAGGGCSTETKDRIDTYILAQQIDHYPTGLKCRDRLVFIVMLKRFFYFCSGR